jgi:GNAT superfamily N-acetyltransferase
VIRRAESRADLELCAEICNLVQPEDPVSADDLAEGDGVLLLHGRDGYAFVAPSSVGNAAYAAIRVRPEARRRGVGSALLVAVAPEGRAFGRTRAWGRVADQESLGFATRRGFSETSRDVSVVRDVAPGDGEHRSDIVELGGEHMRAAYEVAAECLPEMALPQLAVAPPFDEWVAKEQRHSPVAFVALDGDEVVGYARLLAFAGTPHRLENGLTAVRHSHRRRGIATALKQAQIAWAAEHGYREIVTSTVGGNAAMRAVNERLGYRLLREEIVVEGALP